MVVDRRTLGHAAAGVAAVMLATVMYVVAARWRVPPVDSTIVPVAPGVATAATGDAPELVTAVPLPVAATPASSDVLGVPGGGAPIVGHAADTRIEPPGRRVRIVASDGVGIAGARAIATAGERDLAQAVADDNGVAIVPSDTATLRAQAAGFWPALATLPPVEPMAAGVGPARIVLQRAPLLRGRVFAASGAPQAHADVALLTAVDGRLAWPSTLPPDAITTRTDATGAFVLPWPRPHTCDLVVCAAGAAPCVLSHLDANECEREQVVVLCVEAGVRGLAHRAGLPWPTGAIEVWSRAAGAHVASTSLGPPMPWCAGQLLARGTTATDGTFELAALPAGAAFVVLSQAAVGVPVDLVAGSQANVELAVPARARLHGELRAGGGGAAFLFGGASWSRCVDAGADGSFTFGEVPPGRYLVGAAAADGARAMHDAVQAWMLGQPLPNTRVIGCAAGETQTLVLSPTQLVLGALRGSAFADGVAAVGDTLTAEPVPFRGAWRKRAVVDDRGEFHIASLMPGDYEVLWWHAGTEVARAACRVHGGETRILLTR